ncbi:hypothetical protein VNO80_18387 [Phaseolus coccineus]|uniref:Uncharacterized protein n=1 Tax=Phaseolus coccineus TaxID=3886 RepID=A0AAN9QWG1_PHACN
MHCTKEHTQSNLSLSLSVMFFWEGTNLPLGEAVNSRPRFPSLKKSTPTGFTVYENYHTVIRGYCQGKFGVVHVLIPSAPDSTNNSNPLNCGVQQTSFGFLDIRERYRIEKRGEEKRREEKIQTPIPASLNISLYLNPSLEFVS